MIHYLLDTNAFSYAIRKASPEIRGRFHPEYLAEVGISVVSEAELLFGLARRPQANALAVAVHTLLPNVTILPWTSECARFYAEIRADLERRGLPMDDMDMMIAAQALAANITLITNDTAFRRIHGLKVEDWTVN